MKHNIRSDQYAWLHRYKLMGLDSREWHPWLQLHRQKADTASRAEQNWKRRA